MRWQPLPGWPWLPNDCLSVRCNLLSGIWKKKQKRNCVAGMEGMEGMEGMRHRQHEESLEGDPHVSLNSLNAFQISIIRTNVWQKPCFCPCCEPWILARSESWRVLALICDHSVLTILKCWIFNPCCCRRPDIYSQRRDNESGQVGSELVVLPVQKMTEPWK